MSKSPVSRISSKGQVTIPKKVRESMGAKPGDVVVYEVRGNVVTLRCLEPLDLVYHAALSGTLTEWATAEDDEAFGDL